MQRGAMFRCEDGDRETDRVSVPNAPASIAQREQQSAKVHLTLALTVRRALVSPFLMESVVASLVSSLRTFRECHC